MFFDEQFKYVGGSADRVGAANAVKTHTLTALMAQKSGYLYVYVSNERRSPH